MESDLCMNGKGFGEESEIGECRGDNWIGEEPKDSEAEEELEGNRVAQEAVKSTEIEGKDVLELGVEHSIEEQEVPADEE